MAYTVGPRWPVVVSAATSAFQIDSSTASAVASSNGVIAPAGSVVSGVGVVASVGTQLPVAMAAGHLVGARADSLEVIDEEVIVGADTEIVDGAGIDVALDLDGGGEILVRDGAADAFPVAVPEVGLAARSAGTSIVRRAVPQAGPAG